MTEHASPPLSCPHCGDEQHVHRSRRRWHEVLWLILARQMYRCYGCGRRFRARIRRDVLPSAPHHRATQGSDTTAVCPNCSQPLELLLSAEEMRIARQEGRYVSCPKCCAVFVHHAK